MKHFAQGLAFFLLGMIIGRIILVLENRDR